MNLEINDALIPGTRLKKADMGNVTGLDFLSKVFYISEGIMLSQIREVSGIDGSTLAIRLTTSSSRFGTTSGLAESAGLFLIRFESAWSRVVKMGAANRPRSASLI